MGVVSLLYMTLEEKSPPEIARGTSRLGNNRDTSSRAHLVKASRSSCDAWRQKLPTPPDLNSPQQQSRALLHVSSSSTFRSQPVSGCDGLRPDHLYILTLPSTSKLSVVFANCKTECKQKLDLLSSEMKVILIRTGSVPVQVQPVSGSPRLCLSRSDSLSGVFSAEKTTLSLHSEVNRRRGSGIRRALSESDVILSETQLSGGFRSFPSRIPEEEFLPGGDRTVSFANSWPEIGIPLEELGISGGGFGKGDGGGDDDSFGNSGGGNSDRSKLGAFYEEMLKANPGDALLLRNYSKYLHEVSTDPFMQIVEK
ncbi:uncharacterized protein LOC112090266 [Morus notabilis]|nr:uncharacterized protein LOC112090266 [Morus notabilis]